MSEPNTEVGTRTAESVPYIASSDEWFFSNSERCAAFRFICHGWEGTPFREHSRARGPGGGIDCVGFAEEVFFAAGAAPRFSFPRYDADYRGHAHNNKMLSFLRGEYRQFGSDHPDPQSVILASRFAEITNLDSLIPVAAWPARPASKLITGDLLVLKALLPGVWHLPVMQDERTFMHCAYPLGVSAGDITQAEYRERLVAVFRARAITNPQPNFSTPQP